MHQKSRNTHSLRFRRFMRKGYAVFVSLHREVTIGMLKGSVVEKQLRKSGTEEANRNRHTVSEIYGEQKPESEIAEMLSAEMLAVTHMVAATAVTPAPYISPPPL